MKQMPGTTALLVALCVVLTALGALCGAVPGMATDASFYVDDSRLAVARYLGREVGDEGLSAFDEAAVTKYVGLTREEQTAFAAETARQMGQADATFELDILNERERQHMRDVRDLVVLAGRVSSWSFSAVALLIIAASWTGVYVQKRIRTGLLGVVCGLLVLALVAEVFVHAMNTAGFERLFVGMHELLFTNDLWLLNPRTDILIRMMPQPLFEIALAKTLADALFRFAVVLAFLAGLYGVVGGMVRRNITEREQA